MEKIEGEPSGGAGLPGPASLKLQGTDNQKAANGDGLPVFLVAPEMIATIQQSLAAGCEPHGPFLPAGFLPAAVPPEKSTGGKRKRSRPKMFGLLLLATGACLVSGLYYAHHCQTHSNHKGSEARNFSCQTKGGRRKSVPDRPAVKNDVGASTVEDGESQRPEDVEAKAEILKTETPKLDGGIQMVMTKLAGMEAMLAEIRSGVVGLAQGPPILGKSESEIRKAEASGGPKRGRKSKTPDVPVRGSIGRLRWDNDFKEIRFGGVLHNLATRKRARFCIKYLVAWMACDEFSARHLEKQIEPYVRAQAGMDPLPESSKDNLRIQQYFHGNKNLQKLGSELIALAGNGRYYLRTQ